MSSQIPKPDLKYWLAFNQITTIGPIRWQKILNYFPSLEIAWRAKSSELKMAGLDQNTIEKFFDQKTKINPGQELEKIQKQRIEIVTNKDEAYPSLLKEIYAPPPLLYYQGNLDLKNEYLLAIVGSRKPTDYGKQVTKQLTNGLTRAGLATVSGLALGIDAIVHQTTIDCGGKTISVLGSGLDQIYPATNRNLAKEIIKSGGAIVSEFPLGTKPFHFNFPRRNRIIAGLSLGVLITEAQSQSGAIITALHALEQNREVFAVPGGIYQQNSAGTNMLIKKGAKMTTGVNDILETLNLQNAKQFKKIKTIQPTTKCEEEILKIIDQGSNHVDKIAKSVRLNISIVNSTLALMEMKGLIKNLGNQTYIKTQ